MRTASIECRMVMRFHWSDVSKVFSVIWLAVAEHPSAAAASGVPSPVGNNSMMAASPMTDYTVMAVVYVLIVGVLVAGLLIGGLLILNLGLMSKRESDRIGGRTPSDVGILKGSNWPQEASNVSVLPALDGDGDEGESEPRRPSRAG